MKEITEKNEFDNAISWMADAGVKLSADTLEQLGLPKDEQLNNSVYSIVCNRKLYIQPTEELWNLGEYYVTEFMKPVLFDLTSKRHEYLGDNPNPVTSEPSIELYECLIGDITTHINGIKTNLINRYESGPFGTTPRLIEVEIDNVSHLSSALHGLEIAKCLAKKRLSDDKKY